MKNVWDFPVKKAVAKETPATKLKNSLDVMEAMAKYVEINDQIAKLQFQKEKHKQVVKKAMGRRKKILVGGFYATAFEMVREEIDKDKLIERFTRPVLEQWGLFKTKSHAAIRIDKKKGAL